MSDSDLLQTFFQECEDLLTLMDEGLRELQKGDAPDETINSVFRSVHSIKGGAGAFNLSDLVKFSHRFETLLDELRSHRLVLNDRIVGTLLTSGDYLADLVEDASKGRAVDEERMERHLANFDEFLGEENDDQDTIVTFQPVSLDIGSHQKGQNREVLIVLRPYKSLLFAGHEPLLLIRGLQEMGLVEATVSTELLPHFDALDLEEVYLSWRIKLQTDEPLDDIWAYFEFVKEDCDLEITDFSEPDLEADPSVDLDLNAFFQSQGATLEIEENETLETPKKESDPGAESRTGPDAASPPGKMVKTIRVDLSRVDNLVNAVGELVIQQATLSQALKTIRVPAGSEVAQGLDDLNQLSRELQERVMSIRAQQIRPLFQRMFRIVREACAATGKKAVLETDGDTTEVDTAVIERLADPLTHMLRNAVDHGIESPETRIASGKPDSGTVRLSAEHRSGRVVITVRDDGAGINRAKVKQIAETKGLIQTDSELSDAEIDALLFLPGFSTATDVSNLSGRGVGMDVVRNEIQSLGGRISISSQPGSGTQMTISLPLTLAVMDGMVVEVAGQTLVIPISAIIETLRPADEEYSRIGPGQTVLSVRGTYLPVLDLGECLGFGAGGDVVIIVESDGELPVALRVDEIYDQRHVVIKSLEQNYEQIPGVAAATVFGDGRVALILDPTGLIERQLTTRGTSAPQPQQEEAAIAGV
ncbi:MAG: chemotaxis protein CheA [Paracoccaceae bacterium]|nr:chemotaxis protein CheA [Paracoccaceae bacterium]